MASQEKGERTAWQSLVAEKAEAHGLKERELEQAATAALVRLVAQEIAEKVLSGEIERPEPDKGAYMFNPFTGQRIPSDDPRWD